MGIVDEALGVSQSPSGSIVDEALGGSASTSPQIQPPSWPGRILRGANIFAGGANAGLGNFVGLPVDLMNMALNTIGIGGDNPVGGGRWINQQIEKIAPRTLPNGLTENVLNSTGEQVGGLLPTMLMPGGSLLGLAKTAAGAGVASGVARTVAPNSPMLDAAAQIAGGISPSLIRGFATSVTSPSFERNLLERANKPSTTLNEAERFRRLETQLNEGIRTSKGGLEKSKNTISGINSEIQQKINELSAEGRTVPLGADMTGGRGVIDPAIDMARTELPKLGFPQKPTNQIADTIVDFATGKPDNILLRDAQNYKQSINKELDDFYKAINSSPDKTTLLTQRWINKTKAKIADGLRDEISNVFPEVSALNRREGALIQLNKTLERAVNRISQHDLWSLKNIAAAVIHPKYAVMEYLLNNPAVQSSLAVAIRQARLKGPNVSGMTGELAKQISPNSNKNAYNDQLLGGQ